MDCAKAQNLIDAYHDRELDAAAVLDFESHLSHCATCRQQLADLQHLQKLAQAKPRRFHAPPELKVQIERGLRVSDGPRRRLGWIWPSANAAVVMISLFMY